MRNIFRVMTAGACILLSVAACSDDGPGDVSAREALQSLGSGLNGLTDASSPGAATLASSLGVLEPLLTRTNVSINNSTQSMFALGLRETFPDGTCAENIFIDPAFPAEPGVCTPVTVGAFLVLWQSHSASAPPDRMILIAADEGITNFSFDTVDPLSELTPAGLALYIEGQDKVWISNAGSLTSVITKTGLGCSIPKPAYATSATCNIASFDEQGSITLQPFDGTSTADLPLSIPHQAIAGIWEEITGVQPITLSAVRAVTPSLSRQRVPAVLRAALDKFQRSTRR